MNVRQKNLEKLRQISVFAMLGAIMFISKIVMEFLPNIHLLGALTVTYTLVYRWKALIPIYVYVFLNGLYAGFGIWWVPYLYIWTILWGITMLLPRRMPAKILFPVCVAICSLHGLAFGVLYAPFQALAFGFSWEQTIAWIVAGLPFDATHAIGNFVAGFLIYPLSKALSKMERGFGANAGIVKSNK